MTEDLLVALGRLPASDFKARLRADLERTIARMTANPATTPSTCSLMPYLLVDDVDALLAFYATSFGAVTIDRTLAPNGVHTAFRIGESVLMMGGPVPNRKAMLHVYVDDLEATVARARAAGGVETYPITQAPYGERFAVVDDPGGNAWVIAERATSTLRHEDMGTVTPYLNPRDAATLIRFLQEAFGAEVIERHDEVPRGVAHCKVRLGDAILELGDPHDRSRAFPVMLYRYVDDVDGTYARAVQAGAVSIHAPAMQHYGEYVAAFTDPVGNEWYVARQARS